MKIDKLVIEMDKEVLKKTICENNFECLNNEDHNYCKVEKSIEDKVFFIENFNHRDCNNTIPFGKSDICICPVRKEIFKKYRT